MRAFFESAEEVGFDSLWTQEHLFYPLSPATGLAEGLALIERERAGTVAGVPTVVRALLEHPDAGSRDL